MNTSIIKVQSVSYNYTERSGFKKNMARDVSFEIEKGKITSLLGNDKNNNSIISKLIAGMIYPDSGEIVSEKKIIFIPSAPSSFPWLNVKENVVYNLNNIDEKLFEKIIRLVGLNGYEIHFPNNKSYGFRFRISIARALMNGAQVLIFDEPFAFMDLLTKGESKELLRNINSTEKLTMIISSTSILESLGISDEIIVAKNNFEKFIVERNNKIEIIEKLERMLDS